MGWNLVELQGTVEARSGNALDGMELAELIRNVCALFHIMLATCALATLPSKPTPVLARVTCSQDGTPKLIMGKAQLEGEEVKLKKPIAVMALRKVDSGEREYSAVGIVRTKLVFKARPVPVVRPALATDAAPCTVSNKRIRTEPITSNS